MAKKNAPAAAPAPARPLGRSDLCKAVAAALGGNRSAKDVARVLAALAEVTHGELRRVGKVTLPGIVGLTAVVKPATPAREGVNPFTKEPTTFKAKPATTKVVARPARAAKDAAASTTA